MCRHCVTVSSNPSTNRARVLHLLAMLEHPDALPTEDALRIASELLAWAAQSESSLRCEVLASLETPMDNVA
jgi:hypothetical protein